MPNRRAVLTALAASAVSLPLAARAAPVAASATVSRFGELYMLDGWVLTRSDLEALRLDAR